MFTPPPSPLPPKAIHDDAIQLRYKRPSSSPFFRLLAVLLPVVVTIICTTCFLQDRSNTRWTVPLHRRQFNQVHTTPVLSSPTSTATAPSTSTSTSSTSSASPQRSSSASSDQIVPTVPTAPPVLPTPFPQAFDGDIAQNFSTISCASFFSNMTSAAPFRTCRPFSLLLGTSSDFINAQTNLTLLNTIIYGTCNTPTPFEQCKSNMAWFASTLQTACSQELKERNTMAVNTLTGLQAFETLHTAGCLSDPSSHTYCYLTAALATNPFDIYLYSLPLGIHIPKSSTPSCSACSKSVLGVFADVLRAAQSGKGDGGGGPVALAALKDTFGEALNKCQTGCGEDFSLVGAGVNTAVSAAVKVISTRYMRGGLLAVLILVWSLM